MKKLSAICLTIIIAIMGCCFVGCSDKSEQEEYTVVTLTKENYDDYLTFTVELSDYNLIMLEEYVIEGPYYYTASVLVHYKSSSLKDEYIFEDVIIEYIVPTSTSWNTGVSAVLPKAYADEDGESTYSFAATAEHVTINLATSTRVLTIFGENKIKSIEGRVLIPNT